MDSIGGTAAYERADFGGRMAKCPECGKRFFRHTQSVYGARCSYTCHRAAQKRYEAMKQEQRARKERLRQEKDETVRLRLEKKWTLQGLEKEREKAAARLLHCRRMREAYEEEAERAAGHEDEEKCQEPQAGMGTQVLRRPRPASGDQKANRGGKERCKRLTFSPWPFWRARC